jgi:hypothetical protein
VGDCPCILREGELLEMTICLVVPEEGPETSTGVKAWAIAPVPATAEELIGLGCEGNLRRGHGDWLRVEGPGSIFSNGLC